MGVNKNNFAASLALADKTAKDDSSTAKRKEHTSMQSSELSEGELDAEVAELTALQQRLSAEKQQLEHLQRLNHARKVQIQREVLRQIDA